MLYSHFYSKLPPESRTIPPTIMTGRLWIQPASFWDRQINYSRQHL